ncbi:MAG: hypothetical protein WKF76_07510 [Nocardioidaceae bacterium]
MPAPPSVEALPPMPTRICVHPASRAAAMTSPTPRLVAVAGAGTESGNRPRPHTSASSITASPPRWTYDACDRDAGWPGGRHQHSLEAGPLGGIEQPVTAVGHGYDDDLDIRPHRADAGGQMVGHFGGGQGPLELVGGQQHTGHGEVAIGGRAQSRLA